MNLYEKIQEAMRTDDQSPEKISQKLRVRYENATSEQREYVNDVFVTLTGWSLATLIKASDV